MKTRYAVRRHSDDSIRAMFSERKDAEKYIARVLTLTGSNDCILGVSWDAEADIGEWPAPLNECGYCGEPCEDRYCSEEHAEHRSMY